MKMLRFFYSLVKYVKFSAIFCDFHFQHTGEHLRSFRLLQVPA